MSGAGYAARVHKEGEPHKEGLKLTQLSDHDPPVPHNPMKTQKENRRGLYLKTRNNRWKWMAGATAATAAGVTASHASLVTINLIDNFIGGRGGNHLNADLTGDGQPDLTLTGAK